MKTKKPIAIFLLYSLTLFYFFMFKINVIYLVFPLYIVYTVILILIYRPDITATRATFYYATGKDDKAIPLLKKSVDNNTKNVNCYLYYSIYLMRNDKSDEAIVLLQKAKSINKDILNDKHITLSIGSCYWKLGKLDKAIETLEKLRSDYDYVNSNVLVTLGYIYLLNGDTEKALDLTNKAIEDSPESASAWDNLGQIYIKLNEKDKAIESFLKALSFLDLADSNYFLGVLYEEKEDLEKAKEYFLKASKCKITSLSTITKEQVNEKLIKFGISDC